MKINSFNIVFCLYFLLIISCKPLAVINSEKCVEVYDNSEDIKPKFIGNFEEYVYKHIELDPGFDGVLRYEVSLKINCTGNISDILILKYDSNSELMNDKVIKLFRNMPKWEPAKKNGQSVTTVIKLKLIIDTSYYNKH